MEKNPLKIQIVDRWNYSITFFFYFAI